MSPGLTSTSLLLYYSFHLYKAPAPNSFFPRRHNHINQPLLPGLTNNFLISNTNLPNTNPNYHK